MPVFERPDAEIHYEVHGAGYPLLIFAPGGLRSQAAFWRQSPSNPAAAPPWMNPMVELANRFTVIGMDQRNAGGSRGAVTSTHGWHTYAGDHLALMDHLGHRRFHVMGGCIGASFCLTLCELAPERITAAVLQNPIGLHDNRATWDEMVSAFAKTMLARDPALTEDVIRAFGRNMFGGDFVFSVSREFVRRCRTPLLLQPGTDTPHPAETSAEIARLAPDLEIQKDWRAPTHLAESIRRVTDFLTRHTPESSASVMPVTASPAARAAAPPPTPEAWLRAFEAAVRARDFATGRTLFADDAVAFGTWARAVAGLDNIVREQWQNVWPRIREFRFDADARVQAAGDGAWIAAGWSTEATGPDGRPFSRPGRGSFVLERRAGTWLAVHSHFSLLPSQSDSAHGRLPDDAGPR